MIQHFSVESRWTLRFNVRMGHEYCTQWCKNNYMCPYGNAGRVKKTKKKKAHKSLRQALLSGALNAKWRYVKQGLHVQTASL